MKCVRTCTPHHPYFNHQVFFCMDGVHVRIHCIHKYIWNVYVRVRHEQNVSKRCTDVYINVWNMYERVRIYMKHVRTFMPVMYEMFTNVYVNVWHMYERVRHAGSFIHCSVVVWWVEQHSIHDLQVDRPITAVWREMMVNEPLCKAYSLEPSIQHLPESEFRHKPY